MAKSGMNVQYTTRNGQFKVNFEVDSQQDLFEQVASFQEVFESVPYRIKGKDVSPDDIIFRVRTDDEDNKYYELAYNGPDRDLWYFAFPFGVNKKGGGLFPKRKIGPDKAAQYEDGGNGWRRLNRGNNQGNQPQRQTTTQETKSEGNKDDVPF